VEITGIQAKEYTLQNITDKIAKRTLQGFDPVQKNFITDFILPEGKGKKFRTVSKYGVTTRNISINISFPGRIAGKLRGILNIKNPNIISDIRTIFENSYYAYSTNYTNILPRKDGSLREEKPNVEAYHHFLSKASVGNNTYYLRFTVRELKNTSRGELHDVLISEVEVINKISQISNCSPLGLDQGGAVQLAYDESLVNFFNSVKGNFK
jgi:hypothetical protein